MGLTDAGPSARGDWLYEARVYLRETGGVDVTITNVQIQVLLDSKVLGAARSTQMLSMTANSSRDTALVVAADTHVQVSALTTNVTVQFTDAKGNTGSISSSGSCAGCWDY
jgi:c-di-GMP-binding flagellar brake protein YcgR